MNAQHPVYVVDDERSLRSSIKFILDQVRRSCRTFESGNDFLREAKGLERGTVLLDVRMPGLDGHSVHDELNKLGICFPVVMITGHGDIDQAVQAMRKGAIDFLEKPFRREALLAAIDRGDRYIENQELAAERADVARQRMNGLTPRERDVMHGLAQGFPNKTIAYDLGISPRTVEVHRANLMHKLEARNLADALRIAFAAEEGRDQDMSATT